MMLRAKLWTVALTLALICSIAWIFVPGECVVHPAGTSGAFLSGSVFRTFVTPFAFDEVYFLYMMLKMSPIALVVLATLHWKRRFDNKLRGVAAIYTLALSAAVALNPYRSFSDVQLIIIVSIWGIVVLVAHESKASPGSALLALMALQLLMAEVYSSLGPYRGLPFWVFATGLLIVFSYGLFHYTRMLRHSVLGRFTEIRRIDPAALARRQALMDQQRRLEGRK
jgi:hypothetical protein